MLRRAEAERSVLISVCHQVRVGPILREIRVVIESSVGRYMALIIAGLS